MVPTKKQHFIPQMLLKNFTHFQIPMRKPLIYQYDKSNNTERLVDIHDVCRKKYLYEIKDESGCISKTELNLIEKGFSVLESKWSYIICKVKQNKIISQEDRCLLGVLLVLQLIRTPEAMGFSSQWLYDVSKNIGKPLTRNESDKYMKLASFVWGEIKPGTNWMLNLLLEAILSNKDIVIYRSKSDFIINGNRPALCLKPSKSNNVQCCTFYLPITKNHCLGLTAEGGPLYLDVDKKWTNFINVHSFQNEGRFIYGSKSITSEKRVRDIF